MAVAQEAHQMITLVDTSPGRDLRRRYIGASEVPALLGLSPYDTPLDVAKRKLGIVDDSVDTIHTRVGRALEPVTLAALAEAAGLSIRAPQGSAVSDACPRLAVTPDGAEYGDYSGEWIAEAKAWSSLHRDADQLADLADGRAPSGGRALAAYVQVQAQLLGAEAQRGYIAWLDERRRLVWGEIAPDPAWRAVIIDAVSSFWAALDANVLPPEQTAERIASLRESPVTQPDAAPVALDGIRDLLDERGRLRESIAALEARIEAIDADVIEALGGASRGIAHGWRVARTTSTRRTIDTKALRSERPEIAEMYTRVSDSTSLRITRQETA